MVALAARQAERKRVGGRHYDDLRHAQKQKYHGPGADGDGWAKMASGMRTTQITALAQAGAVYGPGRCFERISSSVSRGARANLGRDSNVRSRVSGRHGRAAFFCASFYAPARQRACAYESRAGGSQPGPQHVAETFSGVRWREHGGRSSKDLSSNSALNWHSLAEGPWRRKPRSGGLLLTNLVVGMPSMRMPGLGGILQLEVRRLGDGGTDPGWADVPLMIAPGWRSVIQACRPRKARRRCVEPFFTKPRVSGRHGLGLAMVYGWAPAPTKC